MPENKHTPRPWKWEQDSSSYGPESLIGLNNDCVLEIQGTDNDDNYWIEVDPVNANLIAAAPDLLEALEECVESLACLHDRFCLGPSMDAYEIKQARAAIKKAREGE